MNKEKKRVKINSEISFSLKGTINRINKYMKSNYFEGEPHEKDFYNFFDNTFTCGKCGKKMEISKALFHWHLTEPKQRELL